MVQFRISGVLSAALSTIKKWCSLHVGAETSPEQRSLPMNTLGPALDEFKTRTEQAFRFLEVEYGLLKQSTNAVSNANPFIVRYESKTTAVTIEGVNWGRAAIVSVGRSGGMEASDFELVPLWTLARLEGAGKEDALLVPGQAEQIEASAAALPRLAMAALQGDFAAIDAARAYLQERVQKASRS